MATILFVDDEKSSQEEYKELFEKYGYKVEIAASEDEARKKLRKKRYDLAVIDLVLTNDISNVGGLILAREEAHYLPKIILTNYPSQEAAQMALQIFPDGIPPAINIITKNSINYPKLLDAIKTALSLAKVWQGMATYNSTLQKDYETAQKQASTMYVTAFLFAIFGAVIILTGIGAIIFIVSTSRMAGDWLLAVGSLMGTLAGVSIELIGVLFFRRVDAANRRMDHYHDERSTGLRFEILFNASDQVLDIGQKVELKKDIILRAARSWLGEVDSNMDKTSKDENL